MTRRTVVIETRDQLRALRPPSLGRRRATIVQLPTLPEAERYAWESRLRALLGACGCEAGAICLVLAVVGYAGWAILGGPLPVSSLVGIALFGLGVAVLSAVLGKGTGLAIARYRLARALDRLAAQLPADPGEAASRGASIPA
ncbi:MAG: hypothetical protein PVF05_10070 [Gemmatimonadales bacterium]|jgi:hypothetical protein